MPGKMARTRMHCEREACKHRFAAHVNPTPEGWVDWENMECGQPLYNEVGEVTGNCKCPKFKQEDD